MFVPLLIRWAAAWSVLAFTNKYLEEMTARSTLVLAFCALVLSVTAVVVDRTLYPWRSGSTVALIDLFAYALVLLGLSFLFPRFTVDPSAALTVGLLLSGFEWLFHRFFPMETHG